MKIAVVGCGAMGQVCAAQIAKSNDVEELRLCDIRFDIVEQLGVYLKSEFECENISAHRTDASDFDELMKVVDGVDVVVNPGSPHFNHNIAEAAYKSGAHYVDIGLDTPEEWPYPNEFDDPSITKKWKKANLTALKTIGVCPGISNLLGKYAADRFDRVQDINIRVFGDVESQGSSPARWSSEYQLKDQLTQPYALIDGKVESVSQFEGEENYTFPHLTEVFPHALTDEKECVYISHADPFYLSKSIGKGLKNCDMKWSVNRVTAFKTLKEAGLINKELIKVKGIEVSPIDVLGSLAPPTAFIEEYRKYIEDGKFIDYQYLVVDTKGERDGHETRLVLYTHSTAIEASKMIPGATATSYLTAVPPGIAALMLGNGKITTKGVVTPEMLSKVEVDTFIQELAKCDINIHERLERII